MPLRTADEYRKGLVDGRRLHYLGQPVADINEVPDLRVAVDHAAIDFDLALDPDHRHLAVTTDPDTGEEYSAYYRIPRTADDLLARSRLIEAGTAAGGTVVTLIHEIGTDGMFALLRVLEGEAREKAEAFHRHCRDGDLAVAVAQTDVKGDRSKAPHEQEDPDLYVHVVDRSDEGIVVRGAKCHTTSSANGDEIIVFPTRAMGPDDADYAVSFAIPVNTDGLSLYVSGYGSGDKDPFDHPVSSRHKLLETLTVFDDVFVPWERVFVCQEPEKAGPLALTFVEYHRFTAISYKLPLVDAFVGAAAQVAEMNGVAKAGHIREKLTRLVAYAETVRALTEAAALRARIGEHGIAYPDPMTTNMAKFTFASGFYEAVEWLQDCAGGLVVTGPSGADWDSPDVRPLLEKYFRGAAPAEQRLAIMNLISDLTAKELGGYHAVLAVHAEGSLEAEKLQMLRAYTTDRAPAAIAYARKLAGLD
jgi:4-hydroxybutyryl-CoA dehydratase / vinylacetyl-CoA-Delta-isomerase